MSGHPRRFLRQLWVTSSHPWHADHELVITVSHRGLVQVTFQGGESFHHDLAQELSSLFSWLGLGPKFLTVKGGSFAEARDIVYAMKIPEGVLFRPAGKTEPATPDPPRTYGDAMALWGKWDAEQQYFDFPDSVYLELTWKGVWLEYGYCR